MIHHSGNVRFNVFACYWRITNWVLSSFGPEIILKLWFWVCFIMFYTCEAVGTFCFLCLHGLKINCIVGEESCIRVNLVPML